MGMWRGDFSFALPWRAGWWQCILREAHRKLKWYSGVYWAFWQSRDDIQCWKDAFLSVCLYLVYTVLAVCETCCYLIIMAWRETEGWHNYVFCNDGWVVDEKERWGMKAGMIWRIWRDMGHLVYDSPDRVEKTPYPGCDLPDLDGYLPYREL